MIRIEVNIDDDQLMDSLAALARQGEDATPIMRGLAGVMRSAAQDAFDMNATPSPGPPGRPSTKRTKNSATPTVTRARCSTARATCAAA